MKVRTFLAAAAVPVAALGVSLAASGSALAAPATVYADSSVTVQNGPVDHGPSVSVSGLPSSESAAALASGVQFTASGGFGAHKWTVSPASYDGYALSVSATGDLTGTAITGAVPGPVTVAQNITVTATDSLGAAGVDTLTIGPGPSAGTIALSQKSDNVGDVFGLDDNVTGAVDFSVIPAPATADAFTAGNLPAGTSMSGGGILTAATSIPGTYKEVTVTVADTAGAAAVEAVTITVTGGVVRPDVPRLSGGHAVYVSLVRENVYYIQSGAPSWDHFTIVGPGKINGHQGWVYGHLGLNTAVYGGLEAHHGYTVYYQPVTGPGSVTPVPGSHWGWVYFIS